MMYRVSDGHKLYEKVVDQVKDMISSGMYHKGDMLPSEKELTEMTGVSRITVREAMRILKETGIIETKKGKGSFVLIDGDDFRKLRTRELKYSKEFLESTKVLIYLEPEIAREVALNATQKDLEIIKAALDDTSAIAERIDLFHLSLVKVTGNTVLEEIYRMLKTKDNPPSLSELVEPSHQKTVLAAIQEQHRKIFNAIQARDGEFAYFYMKEHQTYIYEIYEDYFRRFF